jgi:O-acetylserine/cysteine efflux transporter
LDAAARAVTLVPMRPRHLLSVLLIMVLFGSAYPMGKLGVDHFPPFLFAALRSVLLAAALLCVWRPRAVPRAQRLPLLGFALAMGTGVYATMYLALSFADTVAPIVIGTQLSIPMAVMLSRIVLGERVRLATWAAIGAAFAGVVVIAFDPSMLGDWLALVIIAVSALCYATATLCARSLRDLRSFDLNGWMALSAVPLLGLATLVFEGDQVRAIASAGPLAWAVLLHSALVISLLAHVWMFSLYRHYPVATVIPYYVLMPVFGVTLSILVLDERLTPQIVLGAAIVLGATYAVNRTTRRPAPAPTKAAAEA